MTERTRAVVGVAVGLIALATALVLLEMFGTILFAIVVAFVLVPVQRWFLGRGWRRRRAAIATTVVASAAVLGVVAAIAYVAYSKRDQVTALVSDVPESFTIDLLGLSTTLETAEIVATVSSYLPSLLLDAALVLSSLSVKFALFVIVVFGLLVGHERARDAMLAPIPPTYLDFVEAMEERARSTLTALLVLQVGTALATFAIAVPTFWLMGYDNTVALGGFAGALQFLPIIGPIVLLLVLGALHVMAGEIVAAVVVVGVGGVVIGWLPDLLIRPRLARHTSGMSGTLYFVGFIGGIASLGMIGIVAGPLLVALLVEGVDQLAAQMPHTDRTPVTQVTPSDTAAGSQQPDTDDAPASGGPEVE